MQKVSGNHRSMRGENNDTGHEKAEEISGEREVKVEHYEMIITWHIQEKNCRKRLKGKI